MKLAARPKEASVTAGVRQRELVDAGGLMYYGAGRGELPARPYYVDRILKGASPPWGATKFKGLENDTCPFANLPEEKRTQWALTKEEMKNYVGLKPELVAQIEFTEWTPDNHLRHSKFVGLREDKDAREVVREIEGYDSEALPELGVVGQ
jgi:ATP dependent DNA ligase C terminal region